jgi:KipI family sensor histidine kinase inhibitor
VTAAAAGNRGETEPRVLDAGDAALLVVLGGEVDVAVNRRVHRLARLLTERHADDPSWGRPVPAYASLLVPYDPLRLTAREARQSLADVLAGWTTLDSGDPAPPIGRERLVTVRYGGRDGPDLGEVARRLGRSEADVIERHSAVAYTVFMLGFSPGFPYLGPLPDELVLPRRANPRTSVPAGSVAIAGRQTGIYPAATPGGWHLIGRTDAVLWDPSRERPALLEPGDTVRFQVC